MWKQTFRHSWTSSLALECRSLERTTFRIQDLPIKGVWYQNPEITAVFADPKRSTELSAENRPKVAARVCTYFIRAMAVILDRFEAKYVDIHGDGISGGCSQSSYARSGSWCATKN